ncbi:MAG: hypothetical protein PHY16_17690 [Methylobacter sp.]|nr:hypothetical protein [Methylobacter sp.]
MLRWIYQPIVLYVLMALVLVNLYLLIDRWDMFSRTFLHFFRWKVLFITPLR